jgi:hypothetical protein
MARLDGSRPCGYRLARAVNWLPESPPVEFQHGASGLCFARGCGAGTVLPGGATFALA